MRPITACLMLALALTLAAGELLNGIYLGEDVIGSAPAAIAVHITEDGTVTAYRGAVVPGMHDRHGKPVRVVRVKLR